MENPDQLSGPTSFELTVAAEAAGSRLDTWLATQPGVPSRSLAQKLIEEGRVLVDGQPAKPSHRVRAGERVHVTLPPPEPLRLEGEEIPLDIVYEDEDVVVINKPQGLVVHPAPGHPTGTLVNALIARYPDVMGVGDDGRPGIVHRLDKDTSGLMVVAKTFWAHRKLADQLKARLAKRVYVALVHGLIADDQGTIVAPIGRDPANRKRMAVVSRGRAAVTHFTVLERFLAHTWVRCQLETGRTHQIRVHMAHIGHPLVGDPLYGPRRPQPLPGGLVLPGQALHAEELAFYHPRTGRLMRFSAPPPPILIQLVELLRAEAVAAGKQTQSALVQPPGPPRRGR